MVDRQARRKYSVQTNICEFRKAVNLAYGQGGLKLEINIPPQHILAKSKGGLIFEGGVSSSEYGTTKVSSHSYLRITYNTLGANEGCLNLPEVLKK